MDLQQIAADMTPVIRDAGKIALKHFQTVTAERKPDRSYVTAADREVEAFLQNIIHERYPEHGVYGEESARDRLEEADYIWAIDPIDGTEPFVLHLPVWAISVGLVSKDGPQIGFVYLPAIDEFYWAVKGGPAYLNDKVITVSDPVDMDYGSTIVSPGATFRKFDSEYEGRALAFGSAAAHLAFVARGTLHGGIMEPINLWDIAGGACILEAAGGEMRYFDGSDVDYWQHKNGTKTLQAKALGHPENVKKLCALFKHNPKF
ncbi:MAG: inositol monophosphatase [Candidatus Hinthialibacter antarcticus]|nr:inositol monophosphatase [Candidatus Hinthialibacter antarcticus]